MAVPRGFIKSPVCPMCAKGHELIDCPNMLNSINQLAQQLFSVNAFNINSNPLPLDPNAPTTLGFRGWYWDLTSQRLLSPQRKTVWETPELHADKYEEVDIIREQHGIHAHRVPPDWKSQICPEIRLATTPIRISYTANPHIETALCVGVTGIVERFGRFILGTIGWRSEWAVIRELKAPSTEVGLALEAKFPDVKVWYPDEEEENSRYREYEENRRRAQKEADAAAAYFNQRSLPSQYYWASTPSAAKPCTGWTKVNLEYGLSSKDLERAIRKLEVSYTKRGYMTKRVEENGKTVLYIKKG